MMGLIPILALSLALSAYLMFSQIHELRNLMTERAKTSSEQLAILAEHVISDGHADILDRITTTALEETAVKAIAIYSADMQLITQAGPKSSLSLIPIRPGEQNTRHQILNDGLLILQPIISHSLSPQTASPVIGWVAMQFDWRHLKIHQYQTLFVGTVFLVIAFIMCVSLTSYINQSLATDLATLRQTIQKMASRTRNFHAHIPENDEFNEIAEELNQLNNAHQLELQELQRSIEQTNIDLRETLETVEVQNIELDLARREALNASRIKSEFLANTSHEIRTPLSGIIGFSKILLKSELEQRQREAIETIHNSANSLLTIINDILDFSKLEAGKLVLDNAPVNLREVVEDTMQLLAPSANEKELELVLLIQAGTPETVLTDGLRLKQILTNLVNNAIKFTPAGHIKITILSGDVKGNEANITIQVSDTGIGLSKEQQQGIFKDFSQADASITRQYGGTGLGLVIVKGIIEQMGGEIGIVSEPGRGATFWFTLKLPINSNAIKLRDFSQLKNKSLSLYDRSEIHSQAITSLLLSWGIEVQHCTHISDIKPADYYIICCDNTAELPSLLETLNRSAVIITPYNKQQCDSEERIYLSKPFSHIKLFDALSKGLQCSPSPQLINFSNANILAVDDNPSNLHILGNFLADMAVHAHFAQNGAEALQQCREKRFDLIFMDIQMPHMDGIETSRRIRKDGLNISTPIIALSAYLSPDNPAQLRDAGINDYFSKPISEAQLSSLLSEYLKFAPIATSIECPRPVDINECLQLTKGRSQLAADMLNMLLDDLPLQKKNLVDAFQNNDLVEIAALNHLLKGACCYTGTPLLKKCVLELEQQLEQVESCEKQFSAVVYAIDDLIAWRDEHDLNVVFDL
ncbi:ATP-binding protein [Zhongshania aliphaticivorans]|uniref:ATP-binding protein n=1 Tax=Zhongshania aliphaticivorans TaxID=1470434 RepID=UPI00132F59EF|nr:ATP-binding protein [Zhongshania aliphaticivorans]